MLKFVVAALVIVTVAGCQKLTDDPMVKINGKVTLDERVLKDAFVVFVPRTYRTAGSTINPIAYGKTDQAGRFELQAGDQKKVRLGKYRVLIFGPDAGGRHRQSIAAVGNIAENELVPQVSVAGGASEAIVPKEFNLQSKLKHEVSNVAETMNPIFELSSN